MRIVRKRRNISMDVKIAIIRKVDSGEREAHVGKEFGLSRSTVKSVYKNKQRILQCAETGMSMSMNKRQGLVKGIMESQLDNWIEEQHKRNMLVNHATVIRQARVLFDRVKAEHVGNQETFCASYSWRRRFRDRFNLHRSSYTKMSPGRKYLFNLLILKSVAFIFEVGVVKVQPTPFFFL